MHKLARQVRFSINPFLPTDEWGFNSYSSKPAGEGLAIFFELSVQLVGEVEKSTGFVVNVADIDKCVRQSVVPIFARGIRNAFGQGKHIGFCELVELLGLGGQRLEDALAGTRVSELSLKLNPNRAIGIRCEDKQMIYLSEKFEFAATHKLWNAEFSAERNFDLFGKCANPGGHGHNYIVEVTVKWRRGQKDLRVGDFERVVDDGFIKLVDHKNLNLDVAYFAETLPTVENIAVFAWGQLAGKFGEAQLHCVSVWETDKTSCSYYGQQS